VKKQNSKKVKEIMMLQVECMAKVLLTADGRVRKAAPAGYLFLLLWRLGARLHPTTISVNLCCTSTGLLVVCEAGLCIFLLEFCGFGLVSWIAEALLSLDSETLKLWITLNSKQRQVRKGNTVTKG
jgi:hypothetical protein